MNQSRLARQASRVSIMKLWSQERNLTYTYQYQIPPILGPFPYTLQLNPSLRSLCSTVYEPNPAPTKRTSTSGTSGVCSTEPILSRYVDVLREKVKMVEWLSEIYGKLNERGRPQRFMTFVTCVTFKKCVALLNQSCSL